MLESFTSLFIGDTIPKKQTKPLKPVVKKDKKPDKRTEKCPSAKPAKSVGRPRKNPVEIKMPKKSVGRPRKTPEVVKLPKKSVGRPRKTPEVVKLPKKSVGRPKTRETREKIVSFI
jgi:hypothetical protein